MKRRGKIARLPREIRQELNERLHEDEVAASLGEWLNALPAVQGILKAEFAGAPISEQNISEWRKGGYEEWVQRENALEVAVRLGERVQELEADDRPSISEALASWLMVRLAVATRELEKMEWEKQWPLVTKMCANLAKLRRIQKEAKKERQAREDARPQKRKAMAIAEEEVEEWDEALEEGKAELARQEAQAAARPPSNPHESQPPPRPAAKVAEPAKATHAAQVEKMGKAIQDLRAAQVARAVQSAKAAQMAQVVRAALAAKSAPGTGTAPAIDTEPTLATALAADPTEMAGMFRMERRLEKGSAECFVHAGLKGGSKGQPILTGGIEILRPTAMAAA